MGEGVDLIKEFKDAKPPEKAVIIVGVAAVVGVAFYLWKKGNASAAAQASAAPTGQTAGYPMAGNSPVLPYGVNPLYDPNGNLIGFQNPPPGGTPLPPQPPPPRTYTIQKGDTLHHIASMFGIQYIDLYNANKNIFGSDPNHSIYGPGQIIIIPSPPPPPATNSNLMTSNTTVAKTAAAIKH